MEEINGDFPQTDVALVIGENRRHHPAARLTPLAPLRDDDFQTWIEPAYCDAFIKRGMSPGFAGIDNRSTISITRMLVEMPRRLWQYRTRASTVDTRLISVRTPSGQRVF